MRVFITVVDEGSFAAAARSLNRAVSVISYTISSLESQLGIELFLRSGTKRPQLTDAGRAVLSEMRSVAQGMDGVRAKVAGLLQGLEAEVNLAVDVMLPSQRLGRVARDFSAKYPTVSLRLHVKALGAVTALVLEGRAVLGISGPVSAGVAELDSVQVGMVPLIPVVAPEHPLARFAAVPLCRLARYVNMSNSCSPTGLPSPKGATFRL